MSQNKREKETPAINSDSLKKLGRPCGDRIKHILYLGIQASFWEFKTRSLLHWSEVPRPFSFLGEHTCMFMCAHVCVHMCMQKEAIQQPTVSFMRRVSPHWFLFTCFVSPFFLLLKSDSTLVQFPLPLLLTALLHAPPIRIHFISVSH